MADKRDALLLRDVKKTGENTSKNQLNLGLGTGEHLVYIMDHAGVPEMDQIEMTPEEKIRLVAQNEFGAQPESDKMHEDRAEHLACALERRVDAHDAQDDTVQLTTVWKSQYEHIGKMYLGDELQAEAMSRAVAAAQVASQTESTSDDKAAAAKMAQAVHVPRMPDQIYNNGVALVDFVDDTLADYLLD